MGLSNLPPGTWEGDPNAPWNEPEGRECPECGGEMEAVDYYLYVCPHCGEEIDDEPEWDSLPGGHDDY